MNELILDKLIISLNNKDEITYNDRFKVYQVMKYRKLGILKLYHLGLNLNLIPDIFKDTEFEDALLGVFYTMIANMDITEMKLFENIKFDKIPKMISICLNILDNDTNHLVMIIKNILYLVDILYKNDEFKNVDVDELIMDKEMLITFVQILTGFGEEKFILVANKLWNDIFINSSEYYDEFRNALPHNKHVRKQILVNKKSLFYKIKKRIKNR